MTGLEGAMSFMDRASQQRMAEETHALKMQEAQIMAPVIEATARSHLAKIEADLSNSRRIADLRTELQKGSEQAEREWTEIMGYSDPDTQASEALSWTGRWMKFGAVEEFKPLWLQRKEAAAGFMKHANELRQIQAHADADIEKMQAGSDIRTKQFAELYGDRKPGENIPVLDESGNSIAGVTSVLTERGLRVVNLPKNEPEFLAEPEIIEKDGVRFFRNKKGGALSPLPVRSAPKTADASGTDDGMDPDLAAAAKKIGATVPKFAPAQPAKSEPKRIRLKLSDLQ